MHGPLWPLVRAAMGHYCRLCLKRTVTFLFIQKYSNGFELIPSKIEFPCLKKNQIKYGFPGN
jgi:hypothetical protein